MAKIKLDESKVESAISSLATAKTKMTNVESGLTSGLAMVTGARGAELVDTSGMQSGLNAQSDAETSIGNIETQINSTVEEIKAYNEGIGDMSIGERLLSTLGMGLSKIGEGFLSAGEQIVDGFASLIGWGAGKLGFKDAQDSIAKFVAKDHVGDAFHNFYYNTEFGKRMTQASYMSENGTAANICKLVGTAVGYSTMLGAAGLGSSMVASAGAAAVGAMGGTMQAGLSAGMDYDSAFQSGLKNAALSAVLVVGISAGMKLASPYLAKAGNAIKSKVSNAIGKITGNSADEVISGAANGLDDAVNQAGNLGDDIGNAADDFGQAADDFANNGGPKGPNGGGGGAAEGATAGGEAAPKYSSRQELIDAMKNGEISPEDAHAYAEAQFKAATTKSGKIDWHPDVVDGAAHQMKDAAASAATGSSGAADTAANIADDFQPKVETPTGTSGAKPTVESPTGSGFKGPEAQAATPNPSGGAAEPIDVEYADILGDGTKIYHDAAGKVTGVSQPGGNANLALPEVSSASSVSDDLLRAATPNPTGGTAQALADGAAQTGDDLLGSVRQAVQPTGSSTALVPSAMETGLSLVDDGVNMLDDGVRAATSGGGSSSTALSLVDDGANMLDDGLRATTSGGGSSSTALSTVDDIADDIVSRGSNVRAAEPIDVEYSEILGDGTQIHHSTTGEVTGVTPGSGRPALPEVSSASDDIINGAAGNGRPALPEVSSASNGAAAGERLALPEVSSASDDLINGAAGNGRPALPEVSSASDDLAKAATPNPAEQAANIADDVRTQPADPAAYERYSQELADKQIQMEQAQQRLAGLGEQPGNAPQAQFEAAKAEISQIGADMESVSGKMADAWNGTSAKAAEAGMGAVDDVADDLLRGTDTSVRIRSDGTISVRNGSGVPSPADAVDDVVDDLVKPTEATSGSGGKPTRTIEFNEGDDLTSIAERLDKEVDLGNITREEADDLFVEAGEKLHLNERGRISDLQGENLSYEQARQANIDEKGLLRDVDGAQPSSLKGHDEAIRQLDEQIARNNAEIEGLRGQIPEGPNSVKLEMPSGADKAASLADDASRQLPAKSGSTELANLADDGTRQLPAKAESTELARLPENGTQLPAKTGSTDVASLADDMAPKPPTEAPVETPVEPQGRKVRLEDIFGDKVDDGLEQASGRSPYETGRSPYETSRSPYESGRSPYEPQMEKVAEPKGDTRPFAEPQDPMSDPRMKNLMRMMEEAEKGTENPLAVLDRNGNIVEPNVAGETSTALTVSEQGANLVDDAVGTTDIVPYEQPVSTTDIVPYEKPVTTDLAVVEQGASVVDDAAANTTTDLVPYEKPSTTTDIVPYEKPTTDIVPYEKPVTSTEIVPYEEPVTTDLAVVEPQPKGELAVIPPKGETAIAVVDPQPAPVVDPVPLPQPQPDPVKIPPIVTTTVKDPPIPPSLPPTKPPVAKIPPITDPPPVPPTTGGGIPPVPPTTGGGGGVPPVPPTTGGGGSSGGGGGGGGGGTPTPPTTTAPTTAKPTTAQPTTAAPTTAQPTTAAPTTAQPTTAAPTTSGPDPEYEAIPDTMTGKKSIRDYALPAAIGATIGAAGLAAAASRNRKAEYLDDEDDDDDDDDDYDNDVFAEIEA